MPLSDPTPCAARRRRAVLPRGLAGCLALALTAASCALPGGEPGTEGATRPGGADATWTYVPDLEVSHPPFERMHVDWKHRLDQPYVYLEHQGSYLETGPLLASVQRAMASQGLAAAGPPFALYYDDPGKTAVDRLRSRACIPVAGPAAVAGPLAYDVLPSTTVVYAVVSGAYPEVPRSYPGLYAYMRRLRWVEDGPIREIYLLRPDQVADWSELRCEVQIPVAHQDG